MKMALELVSSAKCYNGFQRVYKHLSEELQCMMNFSLYHPDGAKEGERFNALFYLSGLTCSEQNFIQKSGFQKYASEHRLIVIGPDTSPRGCNLPGEKDHWDFGEGAGAYVDATESPWSKHYRMYSYVTKELPKLIKDNFLVTSAFGISGHSMGGHGAIVCGLRNPEVFHSISAFAPMSNPSTSSWGKEKAFKNFLGEENKEKWSMYDSAELIKAYQGPNREILVDQGEDDEFLHQFLMPEKLQAAADCNSSKIKLQLRMQKGFNHSYFFVSTFIPEHFEWHAKTLKAANNN